jgi:cytochrome c-type protein NapB
MTKVFSKIGLSAVLVSVLFTVTLSSAKEPSIKFIDADSIGLRKTTMDGEDNTTPEKTNYSKKAAGTSKKIKRAFQDAPPMIPHDTEGMLPITINDNQCIMCHMPAAAKEMGMGATPVPVSHLTNFRPYHKLDGEGSNEEFTKITDDMNNDTKIEKKDVLVGARFNCSACHAPQSSGQLVNNNFKAKFTDKNGAKKSSWNGKKFTEGLDTVNGK